MPVPFWNLRGANDRCCNETFVVCQHSDVREIQAIASLVIACEIERIQLPYYRPAVSLQASIYMPDKPYIVFGYGSLIWKVAIHGPVALIDLTLISSPVAASACDGTKFASI